MAFPDTAILLIVDYYAAWDQDPRAPPLRTPYKYVKYSSATTDKPM